MTVLSIAQQFARRTGLPQPSTVLGSSDAQVLQIAALMEEEGNDLSSRGAWEGLTLEALHTTIAAESQGTIESIAPGYRYIKNQTIWDRTDTLPVIGPMDAQEWQALKGVNNTGPRYMYRIRGGELISNPAPAAGHTWAFEYVTKYWVIAADGITRKQYFTQDTDNVSLPDELVLMGLRWRWLREKGLDYAELFRTYEMQVKDAMGRDGSKPILSMNAGCWNGPKPGIWVPSGNWNLP